MFIKPLRKLPLRESLVKRALTFFATAIATLLIVGAFAVLLVEWMAGCGETYIDAKGVRHQYECVFIPQPTERK
jgi:hypothetical protein